MKDKFTLRIRIVYVLIFLFGIVILGRLFFVQALHSEDYKKLANSQYFAVPSGYFDRGTIYFKKGDGQLISAAVTKEGYLIAIKPGLINNPDDVYAKLSKIAEIDKELFYKSVEKKNDPYEEVVHRLNREQAEEIKKLDLNGVDIFSESWRFYPAGNLASKIIGFVGYNGDVLEGRYGLEKHYESFLNRKNNGSEMNPFAEIIVGIKNFISKDNQEGDIVLTIDPEVQSYFEVNLQEISKKYDATMAGGIIIEPKTGKILAMAAKPDFDPNNYGAEKSLSVFINPLVQSVFEMGSIMKPITMASALDSNSVRPGDTYYDEGYIVLNNKRIENYDGKSRGKVEIQEILNQSLNTGAVFLMQQMGKEKFNEYLNNFGFKEKTGIDLPDEILSLTSNLNSNKDVEYATASFGQGIAVTPIEMATALSVLANGGLLMRPQIVEEKRVKEDVDLIITQEEKRRVIKKETSEEISRMLVKVVDDALLGGTYKIDHYTVAAKTGTAQIHQGDSKGYIEDEYIHTFFGYAPAFDPKFLVLFFLVNPQGVQYASHSLTEPFMNMTKFLLNYYEIPPDR